MDEYIEKKKVLDLLENRRQSNLDERAKETDRKKLYLIYGAYNEIDELDRCVDEIKPADVAPVIHGSWAEQVVWICNSDGEPISPIGVEYKCSVCGRTEDQRELYCHCGAKMDGAIKME